MFFIYWDNSNIFHEAQRVTDKRDEGPNARYRMRINFDNLLHLAHADRKIEKALAAGSVPPEMKTIVESDRGHGCGSSAV